MPLRADKQLPCEITTPLQRLTQSNIHIVRVCMQTQWFNLHVTFTCCFHPSHLTHGIDCAILLMVYGVVTVSVTFVTDDVTRGENDGCVSTEMICHVYCAEWPHCCTFLNKRFAIGSVTLQDLLALNVIHEQRWSILSLWALLIVPHFYYLLLTVLLFIVTIIILV